MTALNPVLTIGDQIVEVLTNQGVPKAQAWQEAMAWLKDTGIPEPERRMNAYPHQLSGGQRQRAMIAMALAGKPKLLLADEPTTALDVSLRAQILELLDELQRKLGMAVLIITHDLNLVRRFAQRVVVMEQGHVVEQGAVAEVLHHPQHPYTQKLIDSEPVRDVVEDSGQTDHADHASPPLLQAQALRVTYPIALAGLRGWFTAGEFAAVKGANFALPRGRTLGVVGESGSGKSTLALAILGLQAHSGHISFHTPQPRAWGQGKAQDRALRQAVQVVFQDPFSSLSPRMTVEAMVGEGLLVHHSELTPAQRQARVLATLAEVGMDEAQFPGLLQRYPHEFSGGQRQRLAIARALVVRPQLLVLDEPTSALDVTIQKQVLSLLQRLQKEHGLSYLLITHDVAVIRAMAHAVMVMKDGQVLEAGPWRTVLDAPQHPYTQRLLAAV
jgi:microcin C transport system ATP-binding protein